MNGLSRSVTTVNRIYKNRFEYSTLFSILGRHGHANDQTGPTRVIQDSFPARLTCHFNSDATNEAYTLASPVTLPSHSVMSTTNRLRLDASRLLLARRPTSAAA